MDILRRKRLYVARTIRENVAENVQDGYTYRGRDGSILYIAINSCLFFNNKLLSIYGPLAW